MEYLIWIGLAVIVWGLAGVSSGMISQLEIQSRLDGWEDDDGWEDQ